MKSLILFAAFALMGLLIGCQENQMTEPVNSLNKTEVLPSGQWIKIGSPIMDPLSGQCQVIGSAYCKLTEYSIITDPNMTMKSASKVKLEIIFDAELCNQISSNEQPPNKIQGRSEHRFQLREGDQITVFDRYKIDNRTDVILVVRYGVTLKGVSVQQMFLRERGDFNQVVY